jgi:CBS domain-containing protein
VARTAIDEAAELSVADVTHKRFSALPADATVGDVRAWFEESSHRRMAFLADGDTYRGSLMREDVGDGIDGSRPAVDIAHSGPTVAPDASARVACELALQTDAHRVPVVDRDGRLVGVVAVTEDLLGFCGTS